VVAGLLLKVILHSNTGQWSDLARKLTVEGLVDGWSPQNVRKKSLIFTRPLKLNRPNERNLT